MCSLMSYVIIMLYTDCYLCVSCVLTTYNKDDDDDDDDGV